MADTDTVKTITTVYALLEKPEDAHPVAARAHAISFAFIKTGRAASGRSNIIGMVTDYPSDLTNRLSGDERVLKVHPTTPDGLVKYPLITAKAA